MTGEELDRLDALAAAATPGPWRAGGHEHPDDAGAVVDVYALDATEDDGYLFVVASYVELRDAAYIAALSPDTVRRLIARVRETQEALVHAATRRHGFSKMCDACRAGAKLVRAALSEP